MNEPRVAEMVQRALENATALQRNFATTVAPALEKWSLELPKVTRWMEANGPLIAEIAGRARDAWHNALPPNWQELSTDQVFEVIARVRETGYCLVWVPRSDIIEELLLAEPAATGSILLNRRDEVLDDCSAVLTAVVEPQLICERTAVHEAVDVLGLHYPMAAQALAASVFTSAAHLWLKKGTGTIKSLMLDEHPEDAFLDELRLRTIYLAGGKALERFDPTTAKPVRTSFNRHNTAHRLTAEQWTEANALSGVMLSTALVRELGYWLTLQRQPVRHVDGGSNGGEKG